MVVLFWNSFLENLTPVAQKNVFELISQNFWLECTSFKIVNWKRLTCYKDPEPRDPEFLGKSHSPGKTLNNSSPVPEPKFLISCLKKTCKCTKTGPKTQFSSISGASLYVLRVLKDFGVWPRWRRPVVGQTFLNSKVRIMKQSLP